MSGSDTVMERLHALGDGFGPVQLRQVQELFLPLHQAEPYPGVSLVRDVAYGSDARHRLDIFASAEGAGNLPVLVFVHGGGFVGGDKKQPGMPYNDNVALWAVRNGFIGVNVTYRLAPTNAWPAAADDIGFAVGWLHDNIALHGGDASRIHLFGTSAGAAHVAVWIARAGAGATTVASAVLLSGLYDLELDTLSPNVRAYFGEDLTLYRELSSLHGLVETQVPLLVAFAEMDPPFFQRQALALADAFVRRRGRTPALLRLDGHNHFSTTASLNAIEGELGHRIRLFAS